MLLGQTQSNLEDDLGDLKLNDLTVLQHVIKSDRKRERLLNEERLLSAAIDNTKDSTAAVMAYREVCHERLEQRTHVAKQIALRRSGARGAKAKKALLELEAEMKESEAKYASHPLFSREIKTDCTLTAVYKLLLPTLITPKSARRLKKQPIYCLRSNRRWKL